jgi:hypothetical protein
MRTASWVVLLLVGVATFGVGLLSANLAYSGADYPIGGVAVAEVASGRPGLEAALRGTRGTAAAYAAAFGALYLFVVLGPYRAGARWAWWAILAAFAVLVLVTAVRVPTLGIQTGVSAPLILGGLVVVGLLLDVGRLKKI